MDADDGGSPEGLEGFEPEPVHYLVFRCHDGRLLGPFRDQEDALRSCEGHGKCLVFPGLANFAWGE